MMIQNKYELLEVGSGEIYCPAVHITSTEAENYSRNPYDGPEVIWRPMATCWEQRGAISNEITIILTFTLLLTTHVDIVSFHFTGLGYIEFLVNIFVTFKQTYCTFAKIDIATSW